MSPLKLVPIRGAVSDHAVEVIADEDFGFPCRICLHDARVGERLLLLSYSPFAQAGPYRTVGPIYVHGDGCAPYRDTGTIPLLLRRRLLALRAYDAAGRLIDSDVVEGTSLEGLAGRLLGDARTRTVHVHSARPGCFLCSLERAES